MSITRREFTVGAALAASGVFASADPAVPATPTGAAERPAIDPRSLVDPDLRAALDAMEPAIDREVYTAATLPQLRRLAESYAQAPAATPAFTERTIPGAAGQPAVRIFVVNQTEGHEHTAGRGRPAILHIHGGGYILGRAIDSLPRLQRIAAQHDCLIVSVDYRLAPEAPFPAALEDNYAALGWLHAQAAALGVDRTRIAVMGESAGGGHAAALAIAARDRGAIALCRQILIYPMLDDRTGSTHEPPPWIGTFGWKRASNVFGWTSLLGVPAGSAKVPQGAVPARVEHLAGLAPAFIGVGSIDLFVDEDVAYAARLIDAGVPTELYVVDGAYHGFNEAAPTAPASVAFEQVLSSVIARAFRTG